MRLQVHVKATPLFRTRGRHELEQQWQTSFSLLQSLCGCRNALGGALLRAACAEVTARTGPGSVVDGDW